MSDYDTDILEWSSQQAALLRRLAAGERLNAPPDWANIINEVESVGRSQVDAVESLLTQAMLHMLQVQAWPDSREVPHWNKEVASFLRQARRKYTPSMRQLIDVPELYADALAHLPDWLDDVLALPVPDTCTNTLDELLSDAPGLLTRQPGAPT